jgi:hypothetical protein
MLKIGASSVAINGKIGAPIQGATVNQVATHIRDDLEANAVLFASDDERVLLVSCDLMGLTPEFTVDARRRIADAVDVPQRNVIIACTHQHSGPSIVRGPMYPRKAVDTAYLDRLAAWLVELATEAERTLRPARVGWNTGQAKLGYNRRVCYADGSHEMHGDPLRDDCTGHEGTEDDTQSTLVAVDVNDRPVVIVHANSCHPTNFYGCDFFSADYPGASRRFLRDLFGPVPVLYLNGTFGDIAPDNRCCTHRVLSGEARMLQQAHILTGETLRQIHTMAFRADVELRHAFEQLDVPLRPPEADEVERSRRLIAEKGEELGGRELLFAVGAVMLDDYAREHAACPVPVHVIRVGEMGIVTQPCELFTHFGLEIRRRSPCRVTAICGNADGIVGYCPTVEAIIGGGFSGRPLSSSKLSPEAGYRIADSALRLLYQVR